MPADPGDPHNESRASGHCSREELKLKERPSNQTEGAVVCAAESNLSPAFFLSSLFSTREAHGTVIDLCYPGRPVMPGH